MPHHFIYSFIICSRRGGGERVSLFHFRILKDREQTYRSVRFSKPANACGWLWFIALLLELRPSRFVSSLLRPERFVLDICSVRFLLKPLQYIKHAIFLYTKYYKFYAEYSCYNTKPSRFLRIVTNIFTYKCFGLDVKQT